MALCVECRAIATDTTTNGSDRSGVPSQIEWQEMSVSVVLGGFHEDAPDNTSSSENKCRRESTNDVAVSRWQLLPFPKMRQMVPPLRRSDPAR